MGVNLVEFDVHVCKSGELVVIHDNRVDRTTNGKGFVKDMSLTELQSLDAGNGEIIPTLRNVLDLVDKKCGVNIELVGENTCNLVAEIILEYVRFKGWSFEDFFISSFRHKDLLEFNKRIPEVKLGALLGHLPIENAVFAKDLPFYSLNLDYNFINKDFIDDAHSKGFKVFVYNITDKENAEIMRNSGVDGIFLDDPCIV